jgi:hypothetical protein
MLASTAAALRQTNLLQGKVKFLSGRVIAAQVDPAEASIAAAQ